MSENKFNIEEACLVGVKDHFFKVPNILFDKDLGLDIYEKVICTYLYRCSNEGSQAFPSVQTIAVKCGMSKRKADYVIQSLYEKGAITKVKRYKKSKDGEVTYNDSNLYTVDIYNLVHSMHHPSAPDAVPLAHDMQYPSAPDAQYKELITKNYNIKNYSERGNSPLLHSLPLLDQFHERIKTEVTETTFESFIKPLDIKQDGTIINITAPDACIKGMVKAKFMDLIAVHIGRCCEFEEIIIN